MGLKHHSRLGLQIDLDRAFLRYGFERRIIPLRAIDAAARSTGERSNNLSSGQNVRMH
jgi:hypothetical protein